MCPPLMFKGEKSLHLFYCMSLIPKIMAEKITHSTMTNSGVILGPAMSVSKNRMIPKLLLGPATSCLVVVNLTIRIVAPL